MAKRNRNQNFKVVGNNAVATKVKEEEIMDMSDYQEYLEWKAAQKNAEATPQTQENPEQPGPAEKKDPEATPQVVQLEKPKMGIFKKIGNGIKTTGGKIMKVARKVFEVVGVITLIAGGGYAIYRVATRDENGNDVQLDIEERDGKYYYRNPDGTLGDECSDENLINAIKGSHEAES